MEDLIKREDAIKAVENVSENYTKEGDREWHPHIDFITQALIQVPSAEKQGEWISQDHRAFYPRECSRCHKEPLLDAYGEYVFSDFCPNCRAKMR